MSGERRYSRRQRLHAQDIEALLASSGGIRRNGLVIQLRSNSLGLPRLGLIVPRRHLSRAVDRNRLKRVVREWFRNHREKLAGHDVLVRVTGKPTAPLDVLGLLLTRLP